MPKKTKKPTRIMKVEIYPEDVRFLKIWAIKHGWTLQHLAGVILEKWIEEQPEGRE